jgi:fluoroquinolone transport system permease protein
MSGLIMAFAAFKADFRIILMVISIMFSSILFVFIGFIGVSRVKTLNQYILIIPLFLAPFTLPILNFLDISSSPLFYLIPTQASLILFEATRGSISLFEAIYSVTYLGIWIFTCYYLAGIHFIKFVKRRSGE